MGGRYVVPFDEDLASWAVPIPRYTPVRQAANTHLGAAALAGAEGRWGDAERLAREVISVGFLLIDESPYLIGSMIGRVLVERGGATLERVLRGSGQTASANILAGSAESTRRAVALMTPNRRQELRGQAFLESLPSIVADSTVTRSIRWEYLGMISGLTPCLNLQRVVFGPGDDHEQWLQEVRADLVRFAADQHLFDLTVRGFGTNLEAGRFARFMAISMGGMDKQGSGAQLLSTLPSIM